MHDLPIPPTLPMPEGGIPQKTGRKLKQEGSHPEAPIKKAAASDNTNAMDVATAVAPSPFAPSASAGSAAGSVGQSGLFGSTPKGGLSSCLLYTSPSPRDS